MHSSALFILTTCFLTLQAVQVVERFTPKALQNLRDDIFELMQENLEGLTYDHPLSSPYDFNAKVAPPPEEKENWVLIPAFIRLIFHDCAGTSVPGFCDGCLDLDNPSNKGIFEGAIDPLSDICDYYNDRYELSYADCWALAATFAVELSGEITPETWARLIGGQQIPEEDRPSQLFFQGDIPYYIGRLDCDTTPDRESTQDVLPDATEGWPATKKFMQDRFDMTNKEVVAIIAGGHSIGRGHILVSGYSGAWTFTPSTITNDFHWLLVRPFDRLGNFVNWQQGKILDEELDPELAPFVLPQFHLFLPPPVFANTDFPSPKLFLMLNVDIALYYDLSYYISNGLNEQIDCRPQAIPECQFFFPGTVVRYPGETQDDYPGQELCPYPQCPINCEGGMAELQAYIDNNFENLDENANCPAAFIYEGLVNEQEFGRSFIDAFTKMITQGYRISDDDSSDESSEEGGQKPLLKEINLPSSSDSETD